MREDCGLDLKGKAEVLATDWNSGRGPNVELSRTQSKVESSK